MIIHNYFAVEIGNDIDHSGHTLDHVHAIDKELKIEPGVTLGM